MPKPEDRDVKFWFQLVRRLTRMIEEDYTGIPHATALAEYGINKEEYQIMLDFVAQEAAENYDGPVQDADRSHESSSYRASMINAGRGHLLS